MNVARQPEQVRWHLHGLDTGAIFALTEWGVSHIPRALSYAIGHVGTWLAFHLMREATAALTENLGVVMPHLGERELRALALRTYRSYARETIEFIRSLSIDRRELATWLEPSESFARVDRSGGKGLLLVSGHVGNIELGAVILRAIYEYPLAMVVLPELDPRVNARRVRMRATLGIETVEVRQELDTALRIRRLLSENCAVAMAADRVLGHDRVDVQFFGRRTGFLRAPALMAYLTGAPMVPSFILRQADGRYTGVALDPIDVPQTGDRNGNVQTAMQTFATGLEGIVRQYPHLWYNFYAYWGAPEQAVEAPADQRAGA